MSTTDSTTSLETFARDHLARLDGHLLERIPVVMLPDEKTDRDALAPRRLRDLLRELRSRRRVQDRALTFPAHPLTDQQARKRLPSAGR